MNEHVLSKGSDVWAEQFFHKQVGMKKSHWKSVATSIFHLIREEHLHLTKLRTGYDHAWAWTILIDQDLLIHEKDFKS